jgi:hypothetical protein
MHSTFSMPGAIGLPAAAMFSAPAFRHDGRLGPAWQNVSFVIGVLALASGPIIAAELLTGYDGPLQRAAMWTPILWMSVVSLRLYALGLPTAGSRAGTATLRSG